MALHQPSYDRNASFSSLEAYRWAWAMYRYDLENVALPLVLGMLPTWLASAAAHKIADFWLRTESSEGVPSMALRLWAAAGCFTIDTLVLTGSLAAVLPFLLNVGRGRPVELRDLMVSRLPFRQVFPVAFVSCLAVSLGGALFVLPGLMLGAVLTLFWPLCAERPESLLQYFESFQKLVSGRRGELAWFVVVSMAVMLAGFFACAIGVILIAFPLVMLAGTYGYLRLNGENPQDQPGSGFQ